MSPDAFEALFRRSPLPTVVLGREDRRIRDINDAAIAFLGFKREEIVGRSSRMLDLFEDDATRERILGELARQGRAADVQCRMRRCSGALVDAVLSVEPLQAGDEEWLIVQIQDVTTLVEAQRHEARLSRFYSALSEIGEAVARIDDEQALLQAACEICVARVGNNVAYALIADPIPRIVASAGVAAAAYVSGVRPEVDSRVPGRPFAQVFSEGTSWVSNNVPRDPVLSQWNERLAAAGTLSLSVIPLFRHGRVRGAISLHHPEVQSYDPETLDLLSRIGRILSHAFDTIEADRDRRDAQDALASLNHVLDERVRRRTQELESVVSELEAFSYSVAHDLRAPLRAVNAYSQLASEQIDADPALARGYLEKAARSVEGLSRLIDDLLAFARAGRRPLDLSSVDLDAIVGQVVEELKLLHPGVVIDRQPLPAATGDAFLLRRVFHNLIDNALKFSSGKEAAQVEIFATEGPAYHVRDNGVGFDPGRAAKLFGVFERFHDPGRFAGTGVGLAIVRRIVERHGGVIRGDSAPDRGATFSFTLGGQLPTRLQVQQVESAAAL